MKGRGREDGVEKDREWREREAGGKGGRMERRRREGGGKWMVGGEGGRMERGAEGRVEGGWRERMAGGEGGRVEGSGW